MAAHGLQIVIISLLLVATSVVGTAAAATENDVAFDVAPPPQNVAAEGPSGNSRPGRTRRSFFGYGYAIGYPYYGWGHGYGHPYGLYGGYGFYGGYYPGGYYGWW